MAIQRIVCTGDPYAIGHQHGTQAADKVRGSINFYSHMFEDYTGKSWSDILPTACAFGDTIRTKWPKAWYEMQGVADGSGCSIADILALNVRTEIAFGLLSPERVLADGCTTLSWTTSGSKWMGQNWDWMEEQKLNLIFLTIHQTGLPVIKMVTEAGIIGKIGMNSEGLGVCLNAIRCSGNDPARLPIHLALRMALESASISQAVNHLEEVGTGGSGFVLLGRGGDSVGMEFTSKTVKQIIKDPQGRVMHTNHLLREHDGSQEWPESDSLSRLKRMKELTDQRLESSSKLTSDEFLTFFDDHAGDPMAICRRQAGESKDATLFNIVMDLEGKSAIVRIGRPCSVDEIIEIDFQVREDSPH